MTSTRDVHDMLGITADPNARNKPRKKGKTTMKRPDGMAREVFSLLGERAPPVPLADPNQYKAKPKTKYTSDVRWRDTPFQVTFRTDGLVLRHWKKDASERPTPKDEADAAAMPPPSNTAAGAPTAADEDVDMDDPLKKSREKAMARMGQNMKARAARSQEKPVEEPYKFDKYNVKVEAPTYDDVLYQAHLTDPDWTREETDYLVNLYVEYLGKWHVIWDRYEYPTPRLEQPTATTQDAPDSQEESSKRERSIDELKARFYHVSAKVIAAKIPLSNMSSTEFSNHERMSKFDPAQEKERKRQKAALLVRNKAEREEERLLLIELQKIYNRRYQLEVEGRELRARLDHSLTDDIPSATLYTSSSEINGLLQKMLQKDRATKMMQQRRMQEAANNMAGAGQSPSNAHAASATVGSTGGRDSKRASLAHAGGGTGGAMPARLHITPAMEKRFGVKTLDRLPSGVTFKSDRCTRARVAKSAAKTEKIAVVLGELGVPEVLQMPTDEITKGLEQLTAKIGDLIDRRRLVEKEENELRIEKEKSLLDAGSKSGGAGGSGEAAAAGSNEGEDSKEEEEEEDVKSEDEQEAEDDNDEADEDGEQEEEDEDEDEEKADVDADASDDEEGGEEEVGEGEEVDYDAEEAESARDDGGSDEEDEDEDEEQEEQDEDEEAEGDADADEDEDEGDAEVEAEAPKGPTAAAGIHKRSASVLSASSGHSRLSTTKRRRI